MRGILSLRSNLPTLPSTTTMTFPPARFARTRYGRGRDNAFCNGVYVVWTRPLNLLRANACCASARALRSVVWLSATIVVVRWAYFRPRVPSYPLFSHHTHPAAFTWLLGHLPSRTWFSLTRCSTRTLVPFTSGIAGFVARVYCMRTRATRGAPHFLLHLRHIPF